MCVAVHAASLSSRVGELHPRDRHPHSHFPPSPRLAREHAAALKAALAGGALQLVGTDHAVFNSTQKQVGRHDFRLIPNGVNGLEVGPRAICLLQ